MSTHYSPAIHETITINRDFAFSPALVFQAWSSEGRKRPWFADNKEWENYQYRLDFRVGGQEYDHSRALNLDMDSIYDARYEDIVENQRIVIAYTMTINGARMSSSLLTLEFFPANDHTTLKLTEQIAMFTKQDDIDHRREGWLWILGNLVTHLTSVA